MWWQSLLADARYAWRMAVRNPVFTTLAVAALALGIGANTAIFTVVNGVLLKPLPYGDPDRLVMVWSTNAAEHRDHDTVAPLDFLDYRKATAFSSMQASYSFPRGLTDDDGHRTPSRSSWRRSRRACSRCSDGTPSSAGRSPTSDGQTAAIISYPFWQARFGGDPDVLGRVVTVQVPAADDRRRDAARFRVPVPDDARAERLHAGPRGGHVGAARVRRGELAPDRRGDADPRRPVPDGRRPAEAGRDARPGERGTRRNRAAPLGGLSRHERGGRRRGGAGARTGGRQRPARRCCSCSAASGSSC